MDPEPSALPIRVLVADDSPAIVSAWSRLLSRTPGMMALPSVGHVNDLLDAIEAHAPDVVLLDVSMPACAPPSVPASARTSLAESRLGSEAAVSSLDVVASLKASGHTSRVLIYSGHSDPRIIRKAREGGASGFVGKHEEPSRVLEAIRRVHAGEVVFPRSG